MLTKAEALAGRTPIGDTLFRTIQTNGQSACATSRLQVFIEPLDGQLLGLLVRFEVNPVVRDIWNHDQILRAGEPLVSLERMIAVVE
jgi:hypothetical protein